MSASADITPCGDRIQLLGFGFPSCVAIKFHPIRASAVRYRLLKAPEQKKAGEGENQEQKWPVLNDWMIHLISYMCNTHRSTYRKRSGLRPLRCQSGLISGSLPRV